MRLGNRKQIKIVIYVLIAVITLGIGYATIANIVLSINGTASGSVDSNNFNVHFDRTVTPTMTANKGSAVIDNNDDKAARITVTGLTYATDTATAQFTIINESRSIGAQISIDITNTNDEYFRVTETVAKKELQAGQTTTVSVEVEMIKTPIDNNVSTEIVGTITATAIDNAEATSTAEIEKVSDAPASFSTDSWATIQKAVQNNNTSVYNVGDTKSVTINGNNYMVRIANKTIGEHDNDTEYSQTACGFVVEFAEIVEKRAMNSTATNVGGWPATEMRTYLNGTFYNSLPSDLQAVIKSTRVISGHGLNDTTNFTTTDKLYLLSSEEVYGTDDGQYHFFDTAYGTSHQLEYYSNNGVTYSTNSWNGTNLDKAIKQYNSSNTWWWLRPANSTNSKLFAHFNNSGNWESDTANHTNGVAPAFRIG